MKWILPALAVSLGAWAADNDCRLGLPPPASDSAAREPQHSARVALGERLFKDRALSADGTIGCVSCHDPSKAFADGRPLALGIRGQTLTRNSPSLINVGYAPILSWDGRRTALDDQAMDPFTHPREHGLADIGELLRRLAGDTSYAQDFQRAFPEEEPAISVPHVRAALGSYLRSLNAGGSPFDRYYYSKDDQALDDQAKAGLALFMGRAQCAECHRIESQGALLTDYGFHRVGIGMERITPNLGELTQTVLGLTPQALSLQVFADADVAALGHFLATRKPRDIGRFRTPSLRNVALTAPYMHDGSIPTLAEAVETEWFYRSLELGKPIGLTPMERHSLVSFLKALTGCIPGSQ